MPLSSASTKCQLFMIYIMVSESLFPVSGPGSLDFWGIWPCNSGLILNSVEKKRELLVSQVSEGCDVLDSPAKQGKIVGWYFGYNLISETPSSANFPTKSYSQTHTARLIVFYINHL